MKKVFIFIFIISLYHSYSNDMYVKLTSVIDFDGTDGLSNINDYSFFDRNNGVVVHSDKKANGTIIKLTSDRGETWRIIYSDTTRTDLEPEYIPQHWAQFIKYFSDGTIIAITNLGKIIKSTDYGETFNEHIIPNIALNTFVMLDKEFAILTSTAWEFYPGAEWKQLISTDGCETWEQIDLPEFIPRNKILHFWELDKGRIDILNIDNTKQIARHSITDKNLKNFRIIETNNRLRQLCFINNNIIVGGGSRNEGSQAFISKSTDGGKTWTDKYKSSFPYKSILSIDYVNDSILVATGESNFFLLSLDEGETWFRPDIEYYGFAFFGSRYYEGIREIDKGLYLLMANWPRQLLKIEFVNGISSVVDNISIRQIKVFPNPIIGGNSFNFEFNISQSGNLKTYITDISGKEISVLYDDFIEIGDYTKQFQLPTSLASGSYLLINDINGFQHSKLLNIVK